MRAWVKPIIAGMLIETVLFTAMNMTESGSCGPSYPWGVLLFLLHMLSGLVLMPVAWLLPEQWLEPLWFVSAGLLWALLIRGFVVIQSRR